MNYRTFALAGVALIGAAAAAFLAFAPPQPRGPRLIPVEPPAAYAPAPGEFGGRIGPVKLAEPPEAAPDLKFADASGRDIALAAFRGRAIVVNLWATWCVPCVEELPALDRLQAKLGGPGFEVVALAVDREAFAQAITDAIQAHPLITVVREEVARVPVDAEMFPLIIATGPLTSDTLSADIASLVGGEHLYFYDEIGRAHV